MDVIDAISKTKKAIPEILLYPDKIFGTDVERFQQRLIGYLNDPMCRNMAIDPDTNEVDVGWILFLWWIFNNDAARINDALHGYIWHANKKDGFLLDENSHFAKVLQEDIIARAERIKLKDYYKHINWVFHKTQNLPHLTLIGRENVPERLMELRQSYITVLDPKEEFPEKVLFPDRGQRKRYRTIDSYAIYDVLNNTDYKMIGTQNVVIIDDEHITLNEDRLKEKIIEASSYLTVHGRCLFDIPLYTHRDIQRESVIYRLTHLFIPEPDNGLSTPEDFNALDRYIHRVVDGINQSEYLRKNGYKFEIEEQKLTDVDIGISVAARVYLKLSPTT